MDPKELPNSPGSYHLKFDVQFQGHESSVAVQLVLPRKIENGRTNPALVFLGDTDDNRGSDSSSLQGPVRELAGDSKLAAWSPLIVIAPQRVAGEAGEKQLFQQLTAVVITHLLHDLPVDAERVYLTGSGSGGTAAWKLAVLLPGTFAAFAPICGMEVKDPDLPGALAGTEVHIITGVQNGLATDCANRMKEALTRARNLPAPDVAYEMTMGSEVADAYYAKQDFYDWLLNWRRPHGKIAVQKSPH